MTTKGREMADEKNEFYEGLRDALKEGIADLRAGKKLTSRTIVRVRPATTMNEAAIKRLRKNLNMSQHVFADVLNVKPKTVQAWEQGSRRPSGVGLRLLQITKLNPKAVLSAVTGEPENEFDCLVPTAQG